MKTFINILLLIAICSVACNKDLLEKRPQTEFMEEDVWRDPNLVQAYVNDLYTKMRHGFNEVMLGSMTDEARFIHNYGTTTSVTEAMSPEDLGALNLFGEWDKHYKAIRNCNIFFEMVGTAKDLKDDQRQRLRGEVHFLRAYFYHMLVKYWGGVPLVTQIFKLTDGQNMLIPRNSFEECVQYIVNECDSAIKLLPEVHDRDNKGRANKFAAMALKSRILLYAASDLFNQAGNTKPEWGYVQVGKAERDTRWAKARAAANDLIQTKAFALYKPGTSPSENYTRIFLDKDNSEIIFCKYFNKQQLGTSHDLYNGPNGYHNWGGNVPLENFVEGYQMADGSEFSWSNPVHAAKPYESRDPRFYATILYNGAKWKKRPSDAIGLDPVGVIQTGKYEKKNGGGIEVVNGLDTRQGPIENWNGSYTGYYLRKFMDINLDAQFFRGDQAWPFFRYAEILFNYAEATMELGNEAEARTIINEIRTRGGMPALDAAVTGDALKRMYRYERRYELAFEEHRYFDARRWLIAETVFSGPAKAIEIYGKLNPDTLLYTYKVLTNGVQERKFTKKHYLLPIMAEEIRRNSKMTPNPGY
ncbi:RagB/SusD family nutrient uptake outer membrane protein [Chitinophaga lutea]|uniref:RagB/SusD family nutrient uptake outer membrane protein n=1 Tax=Chitinophaga lutea TaxID=2488634 RepID=A0A3N4QCM3_9BACT|nr:RagB/SusD family nutrient uptake outer membrane protein [Chitinophaga lutea]RPE13717.1 RagB/SusD family nutrient uptake outer membrane protein [Chitinophaga lutea]